MAVQQKRKTYTRESIKTDSPLAKIQRQRMGIQEPGLDLEVVKKSVEEQLPRTKEGSRFVNRFLDSASLGVYGEAGKRLNANTDYRQARSFKDDKLGATLDIAATLAGYAVPGLGWIKAAKALSKLPKIGKLGSGVLAKQIPKGTKNRIAKTFLQQAKEGAIAGTVLSGAEVAGREAINPDDYSTKENLQFIGASALGGAVLDPLVYGAVKVLTKGKAKTELPQTQKTVSVIKERVKKEAEKQGVIETETTPKTKISKKKKKKQTTLSKIQQEQNIKKATSATNEINQLDQTKQDFENNLKLVEKKYNVKIKRNSDGSLEVYDKKGKKIDLQQLPPEKELPITQEVKAQKIPTATQEITQPKAKTTTQKVKATIESKVEVEPKDKDTLMKKMKTVDEEVSAQNKLKKYYFFDKTKNNFVLRSFEIKKEGNKFIARDIDGLPIAEGQFYNSVLGSLNKNYKESQFKNIPELVKKEYAKIKKQQFQKTKGKKQEPETKLEVEQKIKQPTPKLVEESKKLKEKQKIEELKTKEQEVKVTRNNENQEQFLKRENLIEEYILPKTGNAYEKRSVLPYKINKTGVFYTVDKANKFNIIDTTTKRIVSKGNTLNEAVENYKIEISKDVKTTTIKSEKLDFDKATDKNIEKSKEIKEQMNFLIKNIKKEYSEENGMVVPISKNIRENEAYINELYEVIKDATDIITNQKKLIDNYKNLKLGGTILSQNKRKIIIGDLENLIKLANNKIKEIKDFRKMINEENINLTRSDSIGDKQSAKEAEKVRIDRLLNQAVEDFNIYENKPQTGNKFNVLDSFLGEIETIEGKKVPIKSKEKGLLGNVVIQTKGNNLYAYDYKTGARFPDLVGDASRPIPFTNLIFEKLKYNFEETNTNFYNQVRKYFETKNKNINKKIENINPEIDKIINEIGNSISSNPFMATPKQLSVMVRYGSLLIQKGIVKTIDWSLNMISKFSEAIRPYLNFLFKKSKDVFVKNIDENKIENIISEEIDSTAKIQNLSNLNKNLKQTTQGVNPQKQFTIKYLNPKANLNISKLKAGRLNSRTPSPSTITGQEKSNKFITDYIDRLFPLEQLGGDVKKFSEDVVRASNIASKSIYEKQIDIEGNVLGKSLKEILQPVSNELNLFSKYLVYRAAKARIKKGDKVFYEGKDLKVNDIDVFLNDIENNNPNIVLAGEDWNNFYKNLRELLLKEKGIGQKQKKYWEKTYPDYAPLLRDFDEKTQFSILKNTVKGGSERNVYDPIISGMEQLRKYYTFIMKNRRNAELLELIKQNPQKYKNLGIEIGQKINKNTLPNITKSLNDFSKEKTLFVHLGDQKVEIKFNNKEIFDALSDYSIEETNGIINGIEEFTKAIKRSATGPLAPLWSVKGIFMDTSRAIVNSENPIYHLGLVFKSAIAPFAKQGSKLKEMQDAFELAGNGMSAALRDTKEFRINTLDFQKGFLPGVKKTFRIINPFSDQSFFAQMNDYFENVNRVAAFNYKLQKLGGQKTQDNIRKASEYARKITTDYTVKGKKSMFLEKLFPYTTASIAGTTQLLQKIKSNPFKVAGVFTATVATPKLIEYYLFKDDKDYQNLNKREVYRNLIVAKKEDGTFVKIPLDPQFGYLAQLLNITVDAYKKGNPSGYDEAMQQLLDVSLPPITTGALQGLSKSGDDYFSLKESLKGVGRASSLSSLFSVATNESFTGAPIESLEFQLTPIDDSLKYNEKTSQFAKFLGKVTDFSPMKIDYLLRAFGGEFARYTLPLTSEAGSLTSEDFLRNFLANPVLSNNLSTQFYNSRENLKKIRSEFEKTGKKLPSWYSEDLYAVLHSQANNSITKQLSQLREQKRLISISKKLDNKTKKQKMNEIQKRINETYIIWNNMMFRYGVPNKKM